MFLLAHLSCQTWYNLENKILWHVRKLKEMPSSYLSMGSNGYGNDDDGCKVYLMIKILEYPLFLRGYFFHEEMKIGTMWGRETKWLLSKSFTTMWLTKVNERIVIRKAMESHSICWSRQECGLEWDPHWLGVDKSNEGGSMLHYQRYTQILCM